MKLLYKHPFIVIHAILTVCLSIFISLLEPWIPASLSHNLLFSVLVLTGGIVFLFIVSKRKTAQVDILSYLDLTVFLSAWTGINTLAFKTVYPVDSIRNYPDLTRFFPVFFVLGVLIIVFITVQHPRKTSLNAWIVMFMMMTLPYTRPLDHHTLAMSIPLMTALYAIHRHSSYLIRIFVLRRLTVFIVLCFLLLVLQICFASRQDFDHAVPDIMFFSTMFFTFILTVTVLMNARDMFADRLKQCTLYHVIVLAALALMWIIRTAATWGFMSIVTYRLWISLLHPNALAAYFVTALFIMIPGRTTGPARKRHLIVLTVSIILLILTQSRGMLAALIVAPFFVYGTWLLSGAVIQKLKQRWISLITLIVAVVVGVLFFRVHYRLFNPDMIRDRMMIWDGFFVGIRDQWITGFGFGSKPVLAAYVTEPFGSHIEFLRLWMNWDRLGRHFHNLFIETVWIFGIPGILLLIAALFPAVNGKSKLLEVRLLMVTLLVFSLFDCPFYYPALMFSLLTLMAISWIPEKPLPNNEPTLSNSLCQKICVAIILLVFFLIPVNAFYHRFVFAIGMHYSKTDPDMAENWLQTASLGTPRSVKAAEHLVTQKLKSGQCLEAVKYIDTFLKKTDHPAIRLMRLRAWLDRNPKTRFSSLVNTRKRDSTGLLGTNLNPDCFLASIPVDPDAMAYFFECSIFTDDTFYSQLLTFSRKANDHIVLDENTVITLLNERGLSAHTCRISYPGMPFYSDQELNAIELKLTNDCDTITFCNSKRYAFVYSLLNAGDFEHATRLVNKWRLRDFYRHDEIDLITFRDGSSDYSLIQARRAFYQGDYDQAERYLDMSRSANVTNPEWYYMMAVVMGAGDYWQKSHDYITTALELAPDNTGYLTEKGVALYYLNRTEEAMQILESVLIKTPWSVKAASYKGIILYQMNRYRDALTYFEQALYLAPSDPWSWFNVYMCIRAIPERYEEANLFRNRMLKEFDLKQLPDEMKERLLSDSETAP